MGGLHRNFDAATNIFFLICYYNRLPELMYQSGQKIKILHILSLERIFKLLRMSRFGSTQLFNAGRQLPLH